MGTALVDIRKKGWDALVRELGAADATRFILLCERGTGNYTEERKKLFRNLGVRRIGREIKRRRGGR